MQTRVCVACKLLQHADGAIRERRVLDYRQNWSQRQGVSPCSHAFCSLRVLGSSSKITGTSE